jgi:hypothetical protein
MDENQSAATPSFASEEDFTTGIQRWLQLDTHISQQNQALRQFRSERSTLNSSLAAYMERNDLQQTTIDAQDNGTIEYATETSYPSYTQKFLSEALMAYFGNDAEKTAECLTFLKKQRVPVQSVGLKRTIPKPLQG